jgi:hypothetical protein
MTKLFIATPAFSGQVHASYAISLAEMASILVMHNISSMYRIHSSGSLLSAERNMLNKFFLESDCTHMLCIDADIAWKANDVIKMILYDEEFIAGAYPARSEDHFHFEACTNPDGTIIQKGNLLKMNLMPAGFMLLKRSALEKMIAFYPELAYKPKSVRRDNFQGTMLYNTELIDGEFWGEDYVFCKRAINAGIDIWCDPTFEFNHAGRKGRLIDTLKIER